MHLNKASLMRKNLNVAADSNVEKINFDIRCKVSQRIKLIETALKHI